MKVGSSKTDDMHENEREEGRMVRMQGVQLRKVWEFKHLAQLFRANKECEEESVGVSRVEKNVWSYL